MSLRASGAHSRRHNLYMLGINLKFEIDLRLLTCLRLEAVLLFLQRYMAYELANTSIMYVFVYSIVYYTYLL